MSKKITENRLKDIGFKYFNGSSNPRYYIFECETDIKMCIWIGLSPDGKWTLRKEYNDCTVPVREINLMEDVMHSIVEHGYYKGRKYQSNVVKEAIKYFGKSV